MPMGKGGPYERKSERRAPSLEWRYSTAIGSSNLKMVAVRQRHAAYHNKHWRQECQHRWLWMTLNLRK